MTCNQCAHRAVCHKEHYATDLEPEYYYYFDLNNVEDKCEHFLHDLNIKTFPCHVGQPVWLIREGWKDGIKQLIIEDMYVFTIRCRFALKDDRIVETNDLESRIQIFLGYEGNPYREIEVREYDFGKIFFDNKSDAEIALKRMKENHNA
jgi:hypothetical protein